MALNHVALTVRDRERSAAFYGEHFGLVDRVHDDEHLLILSGPDGGLLALTEGEPPAGLPRTNHFGFQLARVEEVHAARERLRAAGVTETEWQEDGIVRVQVSDPDGYRAELFAYWEERKPRKLGLWRDRVSVREDFDDPLPQEMQRHFEGRGD